MSVCTCMLKGEPNVLPSTVQAGGDTSVCAPHLPGPGDLLTTFKGKKRKSCKQRHAC